MSIAVGTNHYAYTLTDPVTSEPFTVSVWFKLPDITTSYALAALDHPTTSGYKILGAINAGGASAGDPVQSYNYDGSTFGLAASTTGYTSGTWHHACGVFNTTADRRSFLDGGSKGTNTTSVTGTGTELIICRRRRNSALGQMPSGSYIAEVAVWNSALSDANVALLAAGTNPKDVAGGPVAYWPLTTVTTNTDEIGSNDLTESTTLTYSSDHPTISSPGASSIEATLSGLGEIDLSPLTVTYHLAETKLSGLGGIVVSPNITNANVLGNQIPSVIALPTPGRSSSTKGSSANNWVVTPKLITHLPDSGIRGAVTPIPAAQNKYQGSAVVRGAGRYWFERAHLLPRLVQDVGVVISDQTINCELYNADRKNAITVSSITDNLGTGYVVTGVPTPPFNIASQVGLPFTIKVLRSGDLTINASYTLTLSTGETYTIYIIGSRVVLFPIRPEAPLREHLIFDTKIIEAVDGSEQRIANRQYPRGLFEATFKSGQRKIEMLLFDRQARIVSWPAWHQPSYLSADHAVDDLTVTVDTTAYGNFYVGGYAIVLQDEDYYDALRIASKTATSLTFESGLSYNYAKNTQVMPLLTAYVEANSASLKYPYNQQYFNLRIHTDPEVNDIADDSAWNKYNSKPFMDGPNLIEGGQLAEALRTKVFVIDNLTGLRSQATAWDHNKRYSKKGWKTNSRQELWELYELLHFLKGRQVSFYIPTFWKDLVINDTMLIGTFALNMANIGYTINARQRWPKQFIRIHLKTGSILIREIQNSTEVSEVQEQLTLNASWPATYQPDDIERVEFLEKVRLDIDDIIVVHYNALGQSECVVPIKEVD
jgi:hypothetical protein